MPLSLGGLGIVSLATTRRAAIVWWRCLVAVSLFASLCLALACRAPWQCCFLPWTVHDLILCARPCWLWRRRCASNYHDCRRGGAAAGACVSAVPVPALRLRDGEFNLMVQQRCGSLVNGAIRLQLCESRMCLAWQRPLELGHVDTCPAIQRQLTRARTERHDGVRSVLVAAASAAMPSGALRCEKFEAMTCARAHGGRKEANEVRQQTIADLTLALDLQSLHCCLVIVDVVVAGLWRRAIDVVSPALCPSGPRMHRSASTRLSSLRTRFRSGIGLCRLRSRQWVSAGRQGSWSVCAVGGSARSRVGAHLTRGTGGHAWPCKWGVVRG